MTVYKESQHLCRDKNDNHVIVTIQNCGYIVSQKGYLTRFLFGGHYYEFLFPSKKKNIDVCPTPEVRVAFDLAFLESLDLTYIDVIDG